jgi:hypothetical protein
MGKNSQERVFNKTNLRRTKHMEVKKAFQLTKIQPTYGSKSFITSVISTDINCSLTAGVAQSV